MARGTQARKAASSRKKAAAKRPAEAPKKAARPAAAKAENTNANAGWATDLVFDVKEPKLAVSLRLDADVLRFFRGFGSGYQTRINEVLKAFMHARQRAGMAPASEAGERSAPSRKGARGRAK
ncbi:MAG: BrnA antitoxin family protein [Acetobacteraceae bacterium]